MDAANIKVRITALGSRSDDYLNGFEAGSLAGIKAACLEANSESARLRYVLGQCREFVAGIRKPTGPGVYAISSYHPCGALLDQIDAALKE